MAEMVVALLIAGLIVGGTGTGRTAGKAFAKEVGLPTARKQVKQVASRAAAGAGAKAGKAARRGGTATGRVTVKTAGRAAAAAKTRVAAARTRSTPEQAPEPEPVPAGEDRPAAPGRDPHVIPQQLDPPAPAPAPTEEIRMTASSEMETPQSDGQFLGTCHQTAQAVAGLAQQLEEWEGELDRLNLDRSVVAEVQTAAGHLADAAHGIAEAGRRFEEVYEEVRSVARKGMHFRGEDAA